LDEIEQDRMISSYEGNVNMDEFHNPMKFNSMNETTQMNFDDTFEIDTTWMDLNHYG
jgi:hypothetical protein